MSKKEQGHYISFPQKDGVLQKIPIDETLTPNETQKVDAILKYLLGSSPAITFHFSPFFAGEGTGSIWYFFSHDRIKLNTGNIFIRRYETITLEDEGDYWKYETTVSSGKINSPDDIIFIKTDHLVQTTFFRSPPGIIALSHDKGPQYKFYDNQSFLGDNYLNFYEWMKLLYVCQEALTDSHKYRSGFQVFSQKQLEGK